MAILLSGIKATGPFCLEAQTTPAKQEAKPEPDVLIFNNGEKLIGHFLRSTGGSVTFKSDMAGEVTVDWDKIKELRAMGKFAVIEKSVEVAKPKELKQADIPQGTLTMADQKIEVKPSPDAPAATVAVKDAAFAIPLPIFEKDLLHSPSIFQDWKGTVSAGAALVLSTQNSRSYSGGLNIVRVVPAESWLSPSNRTAFNFSAAYGKVSQINTPIVKTEIFHGDAERDQYFSPRLFVFVQSAFDHNFSQGLDLQQSYGAGVGVTVFKTDKDELDLRVSADYIKQQFQDQSQNHNLFGSIFGQSYNRKFAHGITLIENLTVTPSWNILRAYSAQGNVGIGLPLYKRFNISLNSLDNFLNDPPPGFKKNSFQFTAGLSYSLP